MAYYPYTPEELNSRKRTIDYKKASKFTKIEKTIMSLQELKALALEIERGFEDGRPFDIIDLGEKKLPLSLEEILEFASFRFSGKREEKIIRQALAPYRPYFRRIYELSNKQIHNFIDVRQRGFNCSQSKYGKYFGDSAEFLSSEERAGLIQHLVINDVMLTNKNVNLAVRRYHDKTLNVESINPEKLKLFFPVIEHDVEHLKRKVPRAKKTYSNAQKTFRA